MLFGLLQDLGDDRFDVFEKKGAIRLMKDASGEVDTYLISLVD